MTARWFRVYDDMVDDPKVQRLPAETFRALVNLWCLASKGGGALPDLDEIAFKLRLKPQQAYKLLGDLRVAGLIDDDDDGSGVTRPHNWQGRQFKSDVSNERVKQHRKRQRNVTPTVTATPPEAETDTEAATQLARPVGKMKAELDALEAELREAAGLENALSPSLFDLSPIVALLEKGWTLHGDILPALKASKAKGRTVGSWSYFVPAITEKHAANGAVPAKKSSGPITAVVWLTMDDPRWPAASDKFKAEKGKPPPHTSGEGGMGWHFPADWLSSPLLAGGT